MDSIEDCFVKYFLKQADQIEPETIQSLINHGYRTKLTLTAMDLVHDLQLLGDIPMAQRSLLRKYIGALQETQPFAITVNNVYEEHEKLTKSYTKTNYSNIPIKKRKRDDDWEPIDTRFPFPYQNIPTSSSTSSQVGPLDLGKKSPILSIETIEESYNHKDTPMPPVRSRASITTSTRGRGGRRSSSTATVRTPSQIRFQKMKELIESASPTSNERSNEEIQDEEIDDNVADEEVNESLINTRTNKRTRNTKAAITPTKTPSPSSSSKETSNKSKVLTPAERAVIARIEAKKAAAELRKSTGKSTPRKRRTRY